MKFLIAFLITCFVIVSCKDNKPLEDNKPLYASCEDYCNRSKFDDSNIVASVIIPGDIRCHNMIGSAHALGQKLGYCYDGPLRINGVRQDRTHPDSEACDALINKAEEDCKKLPPDPSMMDQTVSGTAVFKGGKPVLIDGEPVKIKGEVCSCNQKK